MNISVRTPGIEVGADARAYIEYRMFSVISRFGRRCVRLSVRLEQHAPATDRAPYGCTVAVHLQPAQRIRIRASADRLYAAVDRCAERLSRGLERRLTPRASQP
jgi:ribosomal subunit interface protein